MAASEIPAHAHDLSPIAATSGLLQAGGLLLLLSPAFLLVIDLKPLIAIGFLASVLLFLVMAVPRWGYLLFLLSLSVYLPHHLGAVALYPFDIAFGLAVLSVGLDFLLRTRTEIRNALLDVPFAFLIIATLLSALFAYDMRLSIVPSLRIMLVYLAFRLAFRFGLEMGVRKLLIFYMLLVTVLSGAAFVQFALAGGRLRAFGVTGPAIKFFAMTALPMALAFLIWSSSTGARFRYGLMSFLIGLGMLATQSRAPLVAIVVTVPVLLLMAYRKSQREGTVRVTRTVRQVLVPLVLLAVGLLVFRETLFGETMARIQNLLASIHHPQGTVATRLVLWSAAIKAFLSHPLTGIGIGNMRVVHQVIPEMRLSPLWSLVEGLSAHNGLLHYLAETGLLGTLAMVALFLKGLRLSHRSFKRKLGSDDSQVSAALFMAMLVCFLTMLYIAGWTWTQGGYILAFVLGLNAAWVYRLATPAASRSR